MSKQKQKNNFCTQHVVNLYFSGNSINNLLSYCGLTDARMRASEKDLPVLTTVNVVTQEKKIGWCKGDPHTPQGFFEAYQVAEVAMDITYKKSWSLIIVEQLFLKFAVGS